MNTISIIVPVYNEAQCIVNTFSSVFKFVVNKPWYNFIFVDDSSTDGTRQILESHIKLLNNSQISLLSYGTHRGKGYAVKTGVLYANGDYICFLDGDLAYSLEHLDLMVAKLADFDIVIGCRNLTRASHNGFKFNRVLAGRIFNLISRKILNLKFTDMQAGIKGFQKSVAKDLFKTQTIFGFAFDVELLYLAKKKKYTIGEIPVVVCKKHVHKKSQVNLFKHSIEMLFHLLQIVYYDKFLKKYE
ncbi:glycosyltransferase [Brasilonema sp. UFV-L1]|uniref:glycosyltransferase n=1 Tax=Brasilonema sp. UFV-L1 TaxID=2234130 RepID=UPI00145F3EE8|nr:glycosyltransferase [Brasilonema sp. UFV-L1]NMG11228.1 glycosyl transferase [Brasilonema sp. UFV-L1]